MSAELDHIEAAIAETLLSLQNSGLTTHDLADLMGYDNPSMVYAIVNPNKVKTPPAPRFILAARRLCEQGVTRLADMVLPSGYAIRRSESCLINGSLDDEQRELFKAFFRLDEAVLRRNKSDAQHEMNVIDIIVERIRAEVAAAMSEVYA